MPLPSALARGTPLFRDHSAWLIKVRGGDSVPVFANDEFMEVGVFPAHRDLDHLMESVEGNRFRHLDYPPYRGTDAVQFDTQLDECHRLS